MFASGVRLNTLPLRILRRSLQTNSQAGTKGPPAASSERQKAFREKDRVLREEFLQSEIEWEKRVDYQRLTEREVTIHEKHNEAVKNLHFTYDDPETGLKVITRFRHFLKKTCCGNACRHCIYDHQNVDKQFRERKIFNSAFWIDNPDYVESEEDEFW